MLTIACPWCDEDGELSLTAFGSVEELECQTCGTTVRLADDTETRLDLAA
jgi:Zn ribbon nucleic-acid-binding protein